MSLLLRLLAILLGLVLLSFLACRLFWPEHLAVNAPITNSLFGWGAGPPPASAFGSRIQAAEGFQVSLYAELPKVRFLEPTPAGDLVASVPRDGRVVLVERDRDEDGTPDAIRPLLTGLDRPHGVALFDGWLYVAETGAVGRIRFDVASGQVSGSFERVVTDLPEGGNHWTRSIGFGPDGMVYVTVGSSCNACFEEDERRGAMLRFRPDGSEAEVFARGLRNAVGFAWKPESGALYATENGRDFLGDDRPPCELNRVVRGGDYGWPVAYGDRVPDPDLGAGHERRIEASRPPAFEFPAHNAPLGITFLTHPSLPETYRGAALVALHGSWNRTEKDGYEVVSLHWDAEGSIRSRPFLSGFLEGEDVIGRPVDVAQGPDGTLYVSDDYAGAIYRVAQGSIRPSDAGPAALDPPPPPPPTQAPPQPGRRPPAGPPGPPPFEAQGCAACHGSGATRPGMVPVPLEGLAERYDVPALVAYLTAPTPPMPAVELEIEARRALAIHLLERFGAADGS